MDWHSLLPKFKDMPINPRASNGRNDERVIVIHKTIGDKDNGADAAALCVARSNSGDPGVWTWTVGFDGSVYKHAEFDAYLSHAGGINHLGPGIEHDLGSNDKPSEAMYDASAHIVAAFCVKNNLKPSREFIIGHVEDDLNTRDGYPGNHWTRWGGDSSHTDPRPAWDWPAYMARIEALVEGDEMDDRFTKFLAALGQKDDPSKPATPEGAAQRIKAAEKAGGGSPGPSKPVLVQHTHKPGEAIEK